MLKVSVDLDLTMPNHFAKGIGQTFSPLQCDLTGILQPEVGTRRAGAQAASCPWLSCL